MLNTAYGKTMFWDGRAPSLEGQAQGPIQNPIEMGKQSYKEIIDRLRTIPGYREQFQKVFGTTVTLDGMAKAIATFERVAALSGNSAYDKYKGGDMKALSDSQKRGMVLFGLRLDQDDEFKTDVVLQKAKCTLCHAGFNFTDEQFHNLGVGWDPKKSGSPTWADGPSSRSGPRTTRLMGPSRRQPCGTPSAPPRTCTTAAWPTLEAVVDHYDKGGIANPALDPDMKKLNLTAQEKADLVAFMKGLTGRDQEARGAPAHAASRTRRQDRGPPPGPDAPRRKKVASVIFHPSLLN